MNKSINIILLVILFVLLLAIRAYGKILFYDPLLLYFKTDYLYANLPNIDLWRLITNMLFRYTLNAIVSLAIIWFVFKRKDYIKFSILFYAIAFTILIICFTFFLKNNFENGYLLPFYIRRFIIHPLFLLLLLPAFYYQKLSNK